MNSLIILAFSAVWIVAAYHYYGHRRIQNRLFAPLDQTPTPAHERRDGVDYSPAPRLVLFGHHFSSIAGAGPIVGPIIAVAAFGWGPTVLWLLLGGVFIGGVHDYLSLMISARHGGTSIASSADKVISRRARLLFLCFVWLALILVIAVFAAFAAQIMITRPETVLPTFLLIPLAMAFGWIQKNGKMGLAAITILAILGLVGLIWLGLHAPITLPSTLNLLPAALTGGAGGAFQIWFLLLILYAVLASIAPVWLLLQPRDYISSWVLVIGVTTAVAGILLVHPTMQAPAFTGLVSRQQGAVFPFLFIIVACGAVSGFHSIVAGGTSAKQLNHERDGLFISYGSMLAETLVGVIAVIIAGAAISWTGEGNLASLLNSGSPLNVFGEGFGRLTSFLFGTGPGALVGVTVINVFIMTSLDTSVRLARFISGEILTPRFPRLCRSRLGLTLLPVIPAFLLGVSGEWRNVWPVFGSANQLVAALVLIIATAYLYSRGKTVRYTLWATLFMLVTTITALVLLARKYLFSPHPQLLLGGLSVVLILLALLMTREGWKLLSTGPGGKDCNPH